jgi:hypothetical protein
VRRRSGLLGAFWSAYCSNRVEAVEGVIEADPIATAVRAFMSGRTEWTGTASNLLTALGEVVDERIAKSKTWPDSPRALSGRLRRAATFLRKIGIEVAFNREERRGRGLFISLPHQKMRVHNRPRRPHSPRPGQMAQTSLTWRQPDCGRLRATRTVAMLQPSARTPWEPAP